MKSSKSNSLQTFLSIVLIAVLLVFIVGFASNGLAEGSGTENNGESANQNGNSDENKDETDDNPKDDSTNGDNKENDSNKSEEEDGENNTPPLENGKTEDSAPDEPTEEPIYINKMTGLSVTEAEMNAIPIGLVFNPNSPLYGISSSDIAIEFPIEDGSTRLLSYTTSDSSLWKIGSLVETRAFISSMSHFFGGIVVSYGTDDSVDYMSFDIQKYELDLSKKSGSFYKENYKNIFTTKEKLDYAIESSKGLSLTGYKSAPFLFSDEEIVFGISEATSITLPFSEGYETELYYSPKTARYLMYKSSDRKVDMITGKNVSFENVFVLFANAITYEMSNGSEMVIDISTGGRGLYATKGTYMEIVWGLNEIGSLEFYSLDGEILTVNPGNSYVSYYKVTNSDSVIIN